MTSYKGIEIVRPNGKISLSHSRFTERNHNVEYLELLSDLPLYTPENWVVGKDGRDEYIGGKEKWFFKEVSRVHSVASRNYQICNGGISQYYCNGYNEPHAPYVPGDCARYARGAQLAFIFGRLNEFAREVLPAHEYSRYLDYMRINKMSSKGYDAKWAIRKTFKNKVEFGRYLGEWDRVYYEFNDVFETVLELYSQYIFKKYAEEDPWGAFTMLFQADLEAIRRKKRYSNHSNADFERTSVAENFGAMFA